MGYRLALVAALLLATATPAIADIRIDPPPGGPSKPVTEPPKTPPLVDQMVENKRGCGRDNGIEWLFGVGVLGLGLVGLRHLSPRPARRALES